MTRRRNILVSVTTRVVVSVALLLVATAIFAALYRTRDLPGRIDLEDLRPRVLVIEARPVEVTRQWEGFGTARARFSAAVPAQVRGLLIEVPAEIVAGARVEQGQVIARIDPTDFQHEVELLEQRGKDIDSQIAQLEVERDTWIERLELHQHEVELARADLKRLLEARERESANQREVDQAQLALNAAIRSEVAAREQVQRMEPRMEQLAALRGQQQAQLSIAQRNLDRTTIRSPLTGYLQTVDIEPGETVHIDQQIARVVNLNRIEVSLRLPASARRELAVGGEVVLTATGSLATRWNAKIARIAPEDDDRTRTVTVFVEFDQPEAASVNQISIALSPGQFLHGTVVAARSELRSIVPRRSIQADRIRVIDNGIVDSRQILVDYHVQQEFPSFGLQDTQWAVLAEPLPSAALVVVDGARSLPEGTRAEPILPSRATAGPSPVDGAQRVSGLPTATGTGTAPESRP
jgi:multidrug resistance efflux pump